MVIELESKEAVDINETTQFHIKDTRVTTPLDCDSLITKSTKRGRPKKTEDNVYNWTDPETFELIELWANENILYNPCHPKYHDHDEINFGMEKVRSGLNEIGCNATIEQIHSKFLSLRGYFSRERGKMNSSRNSGGANGVYNKLYETKWKFYKPLSFLDTHMVARQPRQSNPSVKNKSSNIAETAGSLPHPISERLTQQRRCWDTCTGYLRKGPVEYLNTHNKPTSSVAVQQNISNIAEATGSIKFATSERRSEKNIDSRQHRVEYHETPAVQHNSSNIAETAGGLLRFTTSERLAKQRRLEPTEDFMENAVDYRKAPSKEPFTLSVQQNASNIAETAETMSTPTSDRITKQKRLEQTKQPMERLVEYQIPHSKQLTLSTSLQNNALDIAETTGSMRPITSERLAKPRKLERTQQLIETTVEYQKTPSTEPATSSTPEKDDDDVFADMICRMLKKVKNGRHKDFLKLNLQHMVIQATYDQSNASVSLPSRSAHMLSPSSSIGSSDTNSYDNELYRSFQPY